MSTDDNDHSFSADETRTLASVLDEIIPPSADGRLPGAGALGVAGYIEQALRNTPELRQMIVQGIADLDDQARQRHARSFSELSKPEKVALLNEQGFIFPLMFQTYIGYYQHHRVVEALGLAARPPHPKGYEMETNDLTLLDTVRRRGRLFREC